MLNNAYKLTSRPNMLQNNLNQKLYFELPKYMV